MESKRSQTLNPSGFHVPDPSPTFQKFPDQISGNLDPDLSSPHCTHCTKELDSTGYRHAPGCSVLVNHRKNLQISMLAAHIKSGKHLRRIILDTAPKMRCAVYDLIAPLITSFKPPSFERLTRGPR